MTTVEELYCWLVLAVTFVVAFFGLYRNRVVYNYCIKMIDNKDTDRFEKYHSLPNYHVMILQFWRYDWSDCWQKEMR